jgi:hypothetical protein
MSPHLKNHFVFVSFLNYKQLSQPISACKAGKMPLAFRKSLQIWKELSAFKKVKGFAEESSWFVQ